MKWQVLRHVTEYNTNKYNTINVSVFRTLVRGGSWIVIPSLPSWVHYRSTGSSFDALWACFPLSISSHVHIVPNVLPRSLCSWPRTSLQLLEKGHNHLIVRFAYLCHMIGEELQACLAYSLCHTVTQTHTYMHTHKQICTHAQSLYAHTLCVCTCSSCVFHSQVPKMKRRLLLLLLIKK